MRVSAVIPLVIVSVLNFGLMHCWRIWFFDKQNEDGKHNSWLLAVGIALLTVILLGSIEYVQNVMKLQWDGPVPLPLLGNGLDLVAKGTVQDTLLDMYKRFHHKQTLIDLLLLEGEKVLLVLNDPSLCKEAFKSTDRGSLISHSKPTFRERYLWYECMEYSDYDLFTNHGAIWKKKRKLLQRAFGDKHLKAMQQPMRDIISQFVEKIGETEGQEINMKVWIQNLGFELICRVVLGISMNMFQGGDKENRWLIDVLEYSGHFIGDNAFNPFLWTMVNVLSKVGLAPEIKQMKDRMVRLRLFCRKLVWEERQRQQLQQESDELGRDNLLSIMVAASNGSEDFTEDHVCNELASFVFAGFDPLAATLSHWVFYVASHPEVQTRLHDEIDKAAQNGQEIPPYLTATLRESQRLQPMAPMLERRLERDVRTKQNVLVSRGSHIFIPVYLLHHDEGIFPRPHSFLPERWLEGGGALYAASAGHYFPFGGGPKLCLGIQLAKKELEAIAYSLMENFKVETSMTKLKILDKFVTSAEAVHVRLSKRRS